MNKFIIALTLIVAINSTFLGREDESMFKFMKFVKQHDKEYASIEEFHEKFEIFKNNMAEIVDDEAMSPFMDVTVEEFKKRNNLNVEAMASMKSTMKSYGPTKVQDVPLNWDWVEQGAVSHVKNQGQCGSCWAFSTVANVEGQNFIKNGKMETFSEQQLVDCDDVDQGCNGGLMDNAFAFIKREGGLESDATYPYTGRDGTCRFKQSKVDVQVTGFSDVSQNEDEIMRVLYENGPLSIAVNANPFQFYTPGTILRPTTRSCNPRGIDHGVTLVGYGVEDGVKFWKIKNSWGASWGEAGYIRMERGTGACGMNTNVSTSILA
jgi:C1A family cysteine protease